MYKASFANGDVWYEWIKMGVRRYHVYRVDGDGSHHVTLVTDSLAIARKDCREENHLYASEGGKNKVAHMTDGAEYLTKEDYTKYSKQPEVRWGN